MKFKDICRHSIITFALIGTISSNVFAQTKAVINDDYVNIRSGPSIDFEILTQFDKGHEVIVNKLDVDFFEIAHENSKAYVYGEFLDIVATDGVVNDTNVNLRNSPSTTAGIITKLDKGDELSVLSRKGDWYSVLYNGSEAYIHTDFLNGDLLPYVKSFDDQVTTVVMSASTNNEVTTYAVVNASGLRLRSEPNTDSNEITTLANGAILDVIQNNGDWVNVSYNNQKGFVSAEFVNVKTGQKPVSNLSKAQEIINFAKQYIGTPYVYGGTSLSKGVDCSGFTYALFSNFGIKLNRTSRDQYNNGVRVDKANLQPGDLVFFNAGKNSSISHVGMYIGNNQFIHSASPGKKGISIASLNTDYNLRTYVGATRVLN